MDQSLLNEGQAAKLLTCSVATLRRWRRQCRGPRYARLCRLVRYDQADLADFVEQHKDRPCPRRGRRTTCS